ncbi:MAG: hypothetical protein RMK29_17795 [Myxococcales bacterium]|nr:hypothetical protein [Myxococcota bacterium]MDW8283564.1 hypothetical protein [Myxococcales bacterium]
MPRIFVSQQRMQQWTEDGKVSVQNNLMILPNLGKSFRLTEAVYVVRVVSEGGDIHGLVGRVKSRSQLRALGAEVYHDSLILGEAAYQCEPGFIGEVVGTPPAGSSGIHKLVE